MTATRTLPTRDLAQAYTDSLWPSPDSKQSEQATLETFARLLLVLLVERSPQDFNNLVRTLVVPLQDFDKRWRDQLASLVSDEDHEGTDGLAPVEARRARGEYARWAVVEHSRLEEERKKREEKRRKGKERAADQDAPAVADDDDEGDEPREVEVRPDPWLTNKELLETRLQSLLLLSLLSLPATFQPDKPKKGRKKKNPEHYSETLDPAMLLDFLTDRMQIWRVMKDVSDLDVAAELAAGSAGKGKDAIAAIPERDAVQIWWMDVVEPLFRTRVDASVLSHHRIKLFPSAASQVERLAQRLEPAPSPFKARSLLSLEKSARRRELREDERRVAESPTMKRLMSMSGSTAGTRGKEREVKPAAASASASAGAAANDDVFKVPGVPIKLGTSLGDAAVVDESAAPRPRQPRKQERPRPLPRGDSTSGGGVPDFLKRRVVSLGRKPAAKKAAATTVKATGPADAEADGRKRKRKSASPKKLTDNERAAYSLTLVPDTPAKAAAASASTSATFRQPFSRTASLPSFAALGAAVRAGHAPDATLPFRLPPPPRLPSDRMDWDPPTTGQGRASMQELGAQGTSEVRQARDDVGLGDEPVPSTVLSTPKRSRQVLVPDT
ncbi:hypothetical protein Rhopal_004677-T1 [Rhodotorula paludigena]|uniref:DNA replication regulator Sld3 C-terminal domain-containing protein n=1 Tax=Rhodotorula paludigena TaxID=86838 RepID=A0AAV5GQY0_9BASI|nr:hypothetical protein Rhopal_004677-T1 [Rhodotorula paludigena]